MLFRKHRNKEETIEQWARRTGAADRIAALYQPAQPEPAEPAPRGAPGVVWPDDDFGDPDDPWGLGWEDSDGVYHPDEQDLERRG